MLLLFFLGVHPSLMANQETDTIQPPPIEDVIALEAFMDGIILATMEEQNIAGATMALVHKGETLLKKGYGYANIETKSRVNPSNTLFRIGSVSKLFTWLAILQLVEQGNLSLDADINNYLEGISIPDTYDEPVTVRSLMSHTPGFEDILLNLFVREGKPIPPLLEQFQKKMPRRIMPPMQEAAYSNYGTGLAQLLVEQASGRSFEAYVEAFITGPLGMDHTTFRQPVPDPLAANLSTGYAYANGKFEPRGFEVIPMTGAGGASTTASDMAIFMQALLNQTRHDTIALLDSATYAIMQQPVIQHAKNMNPALHGYLDLSRSQVRIIGHGGNTFLFHSLLALFPDHDTALFLSFNGENAHGSYPAVFSQFLKRYFPVPKESVGAIDLDNQFVSGFTGRYMPNRRPHNDLLKVIGALGSIHVTQTENGLHLTGLMGEQLHVVPIDSTTFFDQANQAYVGFHRPPGQQAQKLYLGDFGFVAFDRMGGFYHPGIHMAIALLTIVCILYILVIWPWTWFIRRDYERKSRAPYPISLISRVVAGVAAFFLLIFFVLIMTSAGGQEVVFGIPAGVRIALLFPLAAIPFILLMIWNSVLVWKARHIRNSGRLFYTLATLVFMLSIWQLHFWNLLGWRF